MRWIGSEVSRFLRIACHVKQLRACVAGVPLDVAIRRRAHRVAVPDLRERVRLDRARRIFEERTEAVALDLGRRRQPGEVGQGSIEIDELGKAGGHATVARRARRGNHERHARALLEQAGLLPQAVIAQVVAMVAGEDDDRAIREPQSIERLQDHADLCVHQARGCAVGPNRLALARVIQSCLPPRVHWHTRPLARVRGRHR